MSSINISKSSAVQINNWHEAQAAQQDARQKYEKDLLQWQQHIKAWVEARGDKQVTRWVTRSQRLEIHDVFRSTVGREYRAEFLKHGAHTVNDFHADVTDIEELFDLFDQDAATLRVYEGLPSIGFYFADDSDEPEIIHSETRPEPMTSMIWTDILDLCGGLDELTAKCLAMEMKRIHAPITKGYQDGDGI